MKPRLTVFLLLVSLGATVAASGHAKGVDTDATRADTTVAGHGVSYWGPVPEPSDSSRVVYKERGRAAWEWPLIVPYSVINLPLRGLRLGTGALVRAAERQNLFKYVHIVPVPKGVVPSGTYGSESGFTVGLNYYNLYRGDTPLRIRAQYSTEQWQKYTAGMIFNREEKTEFHVGVGYDLRPNVRFFGVGPQATVEDRSHFKDERSWVGALFRRRLTDSWGGAFGAVWSSVAARAPAEENTPALTDVFSPPPGYGSRSDGTMLRAAVFHSSAPNQGNPNRGTVLIGTAGLFVSTSDDVSFIAYRFEAQQFVPVWHSRRALALRGYLNYVGDRGDNPIPFQRMFINELPDQFRGYTSGRWRDIGITGLTAEYRFPLFADHADGGFGIDTALFTDIGQVFSTFDEIRTDNLTESYGFGLRAYMGHAFAGSIDFAWSEEGFQFRLATKQLFQYSRDVLFNGREETLIH